jgi:hypothetical protein
MPSPRAKRVLFATFVTFAVVFFIGATLYRFGSMWTPSAETRAEYEQLVSVGRAVAIEQRFHIPLPGCVCHSDDAAVTMAHSTRHISECFGCH